MEEILNLSKSFKTDENGKVYIETKTEITPEVSQRARQQLGYDIRSEGKKLMAVGRFYVNPPANLDEAIDQLLAEGSNQTEAEEKVFKTYLAQWVLDQHGRNRAKMQSQLDQKVPKEHEPVLKYMKETLGIATENLTFEQKSDFMFLMGVVKGEIEIEG